jgi:hypothetical protein
MSMTVAINIKKLVEPFMQSINVRPTGDDGLHIVGMDRNGYWQEFHGIDQAADFANRERFKDMQAKAATP